MARRSPPAGCLQRSVTHLQWDAGDTFSVTMFTGLLRLRSAAEVTQMALFQRMHLEIFGERRALVCETLYRPDSSCRSRWAAAVMVGLKWVLLVYSHNA